jgi:hypothetical protein
MIDHATARALALAKIQQIWSIKEDEPSIRDGATREEDFGWVFFYNTKRFHQTNDTRFRLAGNGPVVVDRETGHVSILGTSGGVESQIEHFRLARMKR